MRTFKEIAVPSKVLALITCNVCGKTFDPEKDWEEIGEFTAIYFQGGYGSIFGDGSEVECDICQHCLAKVLGEYIRIDGRTKAERDSEKAERAGE